MQPLHDLPDLWLAGALPVRRAAVEFGLSRSRLYLLMGDGTMPYAEDGDKHTRLIPRKALAEYLHRQQVANPVAV